MIYRFHAGVSPAGAGIASASPSEVSNAIDGFVRTSLLATPNNGWRFYCWSGPNIVNPGSQSTQINFRDTAGQASSETRDVDVTAYFIEDSNDEGYDNPPDLPTYGQIVFTASSANSNWGSVTPSSKITKYGVSPPQGFGVACTATPKHGYKFVEWTLNGVRVSTSASFTYRTSYPNGGVDYVNLVAVFAPLPCVIRVTTSPNDGSMGTTEPVNLTIESFYGETVSFSISANPEAGYSFERWEGPDRFSSGSSAVAVKYLVKSTGTVNLQYTAYFGLTPRNTYPPPPWWPYDPPSEGPRPEDPTLPYVEITTVVSPDEASDAGAESYPSYDIKSGPFGEEASFGIGANPRAVIDSRTGKKFVFSHWEDGDGNDISHDLTTTVSVAFPESGGIHITYRAVYAEAEPRRFVKAVCVEIGGGGLSLKDVDKGYGSVYWGGRFAVF